MPLPFVLSPVAWFSLGALLIANLYPIAGVYFYGWDAFQILMLFWVENLIIGVFVIVRMLMRVTAGGELNGAPIIPFFAVHYGMFCFGHGLMLLSWFGPPELKPPSHVPELTDFLWPLITAVSRIPGIEVSLLLLAISQLFSFIIRFVLPRDYMRSPVKQLMWQPYPRIIMLHVAMLFGAVLARKFGEPKIVVALLILFKTAGEVILFLRAQRQG